MPRVARVKNDGGIYHIMVRSISDVALFRDNADKDKYLHLIKKYQQIFLFKIYAYCLMTTHGHILIDCCGADISKIMKSINQCYAAYFNKKYNRHGHVFQDRFKSKLVDDERYLVTLSAYIHNNPKDISKYAKCTERYKYSSLGIYLGVFHDRFGILDTNFILGHFSINVDTARKSYLEYINRVTDRQEKVDVEFKNEGSECRSERKILLRDVKPENIISFVSKYTNQNFNIHIKFSHKHTDFKAVCVLVMRSLGNYTYKDICQFIGNVTISTIRRLCEKGYALVTEDARYTTLINDMIRELSIA